MRGAKKRIRTSFTLDPDLLIWLENQAQSKGITKSEYLDRIIQSYQSSDHDQNIVSHTTRIRIPISQKKIEKYCYENYISKMLLFGSVLTESFSDESDIDVLVEFRQGFKPGLFDMARIQMELKELFNGRNIDLKTPKELSRYFRDQVLDEAEIVYAS